MIGEKWEIPSGWRIADDDVRLTVEDRPHEDTYVSAEVLIVAIGVYDDVGAELEAGVEPRFEGVPQAAVSRKLDDVVDAVLAGQLGGAVGRAVVDDEDLDRVDTTDLPRDVSQCVWKGPLFVEAGDLDDQLHRICLDWAESRCLWGAVMSAAPNRGKLGHWGCPTPSSPL